MIPRTCSGHLYDVLEITPDSTTEDIKRQYRRLALQLHPDRTHGATTEQFQALEEAHRVLSDPEQRRLYDTVGRDGMKKLANYGVPDFLLSIKIIQPIIGSVVLVLAMLLLTLVLVALKLDGPRPSWSWAAVLVPLWIISPLFLLLGVGCVVAGAKARAWEPVVVGMQLLLLIVIPAVACATLQGRLRPPSCAFYPCVLFYACQTVRELVGLVPSVYAARRRAEEDVRRGGDGSGATVDVDSNASSTASNPLHSPCRSRTYWRQVGLQLLQMVCSIAFICLCFARAGQGPVVLEDGDDPKEFLSFWVVFSPLIVYYSLRVVLDFAATFIESSPRRQQHHRRRSFQDIDEAVVVEGQDAASSAAQPGRTTRADAAAAAGEESEGVRGSISAGARAEPPYGSTGPTSAGSTRERAEGRDRLGGDDEEEESASRSLASRLADAFLAPFLHACVLYMVCMWAAKEEVEYNMVPRESVLLHPSVYAATFPLFLALVIPALLLCCLSCAVASFLSRAMAGADAPDEDDPSALPADAHATGAADVAPSAEPASASGATYNSTSTFSGLRPRHATNSSGGGTAAAAATTGDID